MIFKLFWFLRALFHKVLFKKIGFLSYIGKPIFIRGYRKITIGSKVRIFPGIRLEAFDGGEIIIEDNVSISHNVQITSGVGKLIISNGTKILANTYITNIDWDYTNPITPQDKKKYFYNKTIIGRNCFLGIGTCINAGTILGDNCTVGSNSWVRGHFKNNQVIVGSPAKAIKELNMEINKWEKLKY